MNGSLLSEAAVKMMLVVAAGVILAGGIMWLAKENDIPVIGTCADGFDY